MQPNFKAALSLSLQSIVPQSLPSSDAPRQSSVQSVDPDPGEGHPPVHAAPGEVEPGAERVRRDQAQGDAGREGGGGGGGRGKHDSTSITVLVAVANVLSHIVCLGLGGPPSSARPLISSWFWGFLVLSFCFSTSSRAACGHFTANGDQLRKVASLHYFVAFLHRRKPGRWQSSIFFLYSLSFPPSLTYIACISNGSLSSFFSTPLPSLHPFLSPPT